MSRTTCLLIALATTAACTARLPEPQPVDDAAEALGGRDRILAIKTLTIEGEGTNGKAGHDPGRDLRRSRSRAPAPGRPFR